MSGWIVLLSSMLNGVTRLITKEQYSPDLMLKLIEKYRITSIFSAPYQMMLVTQSPKIVSYNLDSVKLVQVGGSFVSDGLKESLQKYLKNATVAVVYGATEIGGYISSTYCSDRNGSVGQLTDGIKIKILDEDRRLLGVNEVGEICGTSGFPFLGYKNNVKATREALDKDGWVLTDDLGYFDEDGFLILMDRKKDIIRYCGYQISPSEIEVVIQQLPEVLSVSVVGIPDSLYVDLPAAVIVRGSETLSEQMVIDYVAQHVPDQKQLRGGVYFIDKLPLTYSGKIMRREVKKIAIELSERRK
jgi:4-coumarate--CoA ligase